MGLLDQFTNLSPDQTQGLLAAASQILQQSGDPRRPYGLGQALGSGIESFQASTEAARQRKLQEEQMAQQKQLYGLKIRDAQSDFANQEAMRNRAAALQTLSKDYFSRAPQDPATMAISGMKGPTIENAEQLSQVQSKTSQGGSPSRFDSRMGWADYLRKNGYNTEAENEEKSALNFQPKVKNWQEVRQGDQVLYAPFFEDGTAGQPVPLEIARKLEKVDSGQSTDMTDPFTGEVKSSIKKRQTLESLATERTAAAGRAQAERHFQQQESAPQYMDTSDGLVALPKRLGPGQAPVGLPVLDSKGSRLEKKQNIPQFVTTGVTGNAKSLSIIDNALKSLDTKDGANAVGFKGYLPNGILNRVDPNGTSTRADISDVGSLTLHDRSGAAVTAAESPRLMPFIPLATDDTATAKKKLTRMRELIQAETNNLTFAYPQAKNLANYAAQNAPSNAGASDIPADIDALLKKHGGK